MSDTQKTKIERVKKALPKALARAALAVGCTAAAMGIAGLTISGTGLAVAGVFAFLATRA